MIKPQQKGPFTPFPPRIYICFSIQQSLLATDQTSFMIYVET